MATVTDSSEGTGRQDEALRPEQSERKRSARRERERKTGREGERDAGWAASDADVAAVCCRTCVFVCVRASGVHETVCVC